MNEPGSGVILEILPGSIIDNSDAVIRYDSYWSLAYKNDSFIGNENGADALPFTCNRFDYFYHSQINQDCIFCPLPARWDDINGNCGDRYHCTRSSLWCSDIDNTNFSSYWSGDSVSGYCTVCPIDSGIIHRGNSEPICHCSCNQGYQQESNDLFICKQFGQFYCPECQNSFLTGNVFTQIICIYVIASIT